MTLVRPDGIRVKDITAIEAAIPYIMPHRYDAQNMVTKYADMDPMREYIRRKQKEGVRVSYMGLLLAAYHRSYLENPRINRFVVNKKIYQRNHFCVSFVILKAGAEGAQEETTLKVFFDPEDDVLSINGKIESAIAENEKAEFDNATDKFANAVFRVPLLPGIVVGLVRLLDRHGLLPRAIIDLSPFHTSLFITNLASINTSHIFHHTYDFGTTSMFVCMGRPELNYIKGDYGKKVMPLTCVMDERICTGVDFAHFWASVNKYLNHPELLEGGTWETPGDASETERE